MPVSHLPAAVSAPLGRLMLNGSPAAGWVSHDITSVNSYQIDKISARISLGDNIAQGLQYWSGLLNAAPVLCDAQASLNGGGWSSVFQGQLDDFDYTPESSMITLTGRSMAAALIDHQTAETFQNQTVSQIVNALSTRRGLTPHVDSGADQAGQLYTRDYASQHFLQSGKKRTEWEVLTLLAQEIGYALYVIGTDLYFQPIATTSASPWLVSFQQSPPASNVWGHKVSRSLYWSRPISVTVMSQHAKTGTAKAVASAPGVGDVLEHIFPRPGWSQTRCQTWATQKLASLMLQRATLRFTTFYDPLLTAQAMVQQVGMGAPFDSLYFPRTLTKAFSPKGCTIAAECCLSNPLDGETADALEGT